MTPGLDRLRRLLAEKSVTADLELGVLLLDAGDEIAALIEAARELHDDVGVVFSDDRLDYIEVQMDPASLARLEEALAALDRKLAQP